MYDLAFPDEAVAAMECCAGAANQRKFICVSTFMTWARTELPERVADEDDDDPTHKIDPDDLPDEREMEPEEVAKLYKKAKKPAPAWVTRKLEEIRKQEEAERAAEAAEEADENGVENPENNGAEPNDAENEEEKADEEEASEPEEDENDEEEDEEERLLKLPEFGLRETDFALRRPHPAFRAQFEAEERISAALARSESVSGAIVVPGVVYGYGETAMTGLFKRIYRGEVEKAPLYAGGHGRVVPFVHALDLALLVHALCTEQCPSKEEPFVFASERRQVSARAFAESLGLKLLTDDPKREWMVSEKARRARDDPPKPLTKQTYKLWVARRNASVPLPSYVEEIGRDETALGVETI